ncbi:MAG: aminodeoxychorismate synthase component I [Chloroflexota bacterium]
MSSLADQSGTQQWPIEEGSTVLPLYRELETAVPLHRLFTIFLNDPYPVFLDSSLYHERLGRYSYVTADPLLVLQSKNGRVEVNGDANPCTPKGDPFECLRQLVYRLETEFVPGLPPFQGGAVGYFGYDLAHHIESLPRTAVDDVGVPDMVVGIYDWVLAYDHASARTWLVVSPYPHGDYERARHRLEMVASRLAQLEPEPVSRRARPLARPLASTFDRKGYVDAILRAKEHIAAGDIYQVNLSQRFQVTLPISPWQLYRCLREVSPVPYSAYLQLGDLAVASASPELFLRKEGSRVETRPIKGTRPRGKTPEEDRRLAEELLASEKDRAENVMIVDLLRNDLGKVCRVGTVRVPELYSLESYSTIHHLVSAVEGVLDGRHDAVSLLRACFPGGSVTGCPKIRAMEIIDELEPTQRGVYCGSIGYLGFNGNLDTSIVIRTIVVKGGQAYFQVGGAIVADSDPEDEYQETLDKARAMILALGGDRAWSTA